MDFTSIKTWDLRDDDAYCNGFQPQDKCDADLTCAWCIDKNDPPSVEAKCWSVKTSLTMKDEFDCTAKSISQNDDQYCSQHYEEEQNCNNDDICAWCTYKTNISQCTSLESAKKLPKEMFICDKKSEETVFLN